MAKVFFSSILSVDVEVSVCKSNKKLSLGHDVYEKYSYENDQKRYEYLFLKFNNEIQSKDLIGEHSYINAHT